jgi:hypothetical protein
MPVNANVELQCFRSVKTTALLARLARLRQPATHAQLLPAPHGRLHRHTTHRGSFR